MFACTVIFVPLLICFYIIVCRNKSSTELMLHMFKHVRPKIKFLNLNLNLIVFGDYYTKWKEAFAVPNHTALTVADKLVTEIICRLGCPEQLHTEQGREFESELFQSVCSKLGIEKTRTTPYRPQSDGLVERFIRTLRQMLSIYVQENQRDWDDHLPYLLMAYRSTVHKSTKCTPNQLMIGREINCPIDVMVGPPPDCKGHECTVVYVEWMQTAMQNAFEFAHSQLDSAAVRQKRGYDNQLKIRSFEEGSWVWRWYPPKAGLKLGLGWTGPYLVLRKVTDLTYVIQKTERSPVISVHVDHLKPYVGRNPPQSWLQSDDEDDLSDADERVDDDDESDDVGDDADDDAPSTPVVQTTRRGRVVKPREIYSP